MIIGASTAVPWILAMAFCIHDLEAIQTSSLPSLELFYQATGSKGTATFLQAYLTLLYYSMSIPSISRPLSKLTFNVQLAFLVNGLPRVESLGH